MLLNILSYIANNLVPGKVMTLADINKDLVECGIEPITLDQVVIKFVHWYDEEEEN